VVFLGVNADSVTAFEKRQRQELHLQVIEAAEVMVDARAAALRALEWLPPDIESLLVHFDVDVIDFFDLPLAENYVRFGGLRLADAQEVLRTLLSDRRFDGLTITELNPDHGAEDGSTLSSFIDLLVDASSESPRLVR
jgi:arginase